VKYSHTRYKLRRCDSRDRVWTLFLLRDRKTKENAYPRGRPSLFPSRIPFRPLMQIVPLAFNYASRESLPGDFDRIFRPQASWEIQHAPLVRHSRVRVLSRTSVREKLFAEGRHETIRRHKARNINDYENDESWNWQTKLRETIPIRCQCELKMSRRTFIVTLKGDISLGILTRFFSCKTL